MKNKLSYLTLLFSLTLVTSCVNKESVPQRILNDEVLLKDVYKEVNYSDTLTLTSLKKPEKLDNMQDFSDFMDYVVFESENDEVIYTTLTDSYKNELINNFAYNFQWAGQYGSLAHNFIKGYDTSHLENGEIGAFGSFTDYAFKSFDKKEKDISVINYKYYEDVISKHYDFNYKVEDLPLYKKNNGFIEVRNSDQLFYALSKNYFPVTEKGSVAEKCLSLMLGILSQTVNLNDSDEKKYENLYQYIINETQYDYEAYSSKNSIHTDYTCYFLEGVLFNHLAVCDGLTKALTSLSRLIGLEAYHVGAVGHSGGHAYNYINIDSSYYLSCTTTASSKDTYHDYNLHNHTNLYFLTNYYTSSPTTWDYASLSYPNLIEKVKEVTPYDYYSNSSISLKGNTYSLKINSKEEAKDILTSLNDLAKEKSLILEIELNGNFSYLNEAYKEINSDDILKINKGVFNSERVVNYVFLGVNI